MKGEATEGRMEVLEHLKSKMTMTKTNEQNRE